MIWLSRAILFLVVLIPVSVSISAFDGVNLALVKVAIAVLFLWWAVLFVRKKVVLVVDAILLVMLVWLGVMWVSLFFSQDSFEGFKKWLTIASMVPLYGIIISIATAEWRVRVQQILIWAGAIAALGGIGTFIAQFFIDPNTISDFFQTVWYPLLFGESFSEKISAYSSMWVNISGVNYFRANAFFPNPHVAGFFLGMTLWCAGHEYRMSRSRFALVALILITVAFSLTFARGAYLSLLLAIVLIGFNYWRRRNLNLNTSAIILTALIIVVFSLSPLSVRLRSALDRDEGSVKERINIALEGVLQAGEHPWIGIGLGSYGVSQKLALENDTSPANLHNSYLELFIESGIFASIAFLLILWIGLFYAVSTGSWWLGGALLFFGLYAGFETIIYSHQVMPLLMILLALAYEENKKSEL